MSKEYMLYIRNIGDAKAGLPDGDHLAFIKQCEVYIGKLKNEGRLIAAQPLVREGCVIGKNDSNWFITNINPNALVQVGYYHILAENMDEAIAIAKDNPEFAYVPSATIEVRPVKTKEAPTNFVYPK